MARKTKEETQETKESILRAATTVFLEKGVAKATLEEIATEAGVTRGAVYWHFKNKKDLFDALEDKLNKPFTELILHYLESEQDAPLQQLQDFCVFALQSLAAEPLTRDILTVFCLRCDYVGEMEDILERQRENKLKNFALIEQYFHRAREKGQISENMSPKCLATGLACYLDGIVLEYLRDPESFDITTRAEPLMRIFFRGVEARK